MMMNLKCYLTGIATALLFGCNTQKGHNEKTEEVSKSIEAKTDEQRDLTIYVDLIEAFYGQKDYFIPLYSKDNYSEATSKIIERHQKERVFADDEITRTKLDEEIVTKFLSVENLDKLIVFGEDQNILDTLFRKNYEYYENMIESQYVATYEAKLPQNDFVVVSLNGLNRNHIQKSPVIHQDSIYLQKIIKDNFFEPDYIYSYGHLAHDVDTIAYFSFSDYKKGKDCAFLLKNTAVVDSVINDFIISDLTPVPLSSENYLMYIASISIPETDLFWTALIAIDLRNDKLKLYTRNRLSIKNNTIRYE